MRLERKEGKKAGNRSCKTLKDHGKDLNFKSMNSRETYSFKNIVSSMENDIRGRA